MPGDGGAGGIHVLGRAGAGERWRGGVGRRGRGLLLLDVLRVRRRRGSGPGWARGERDADRWAVAVHDVRRGGPGAKGRRRDALAVSLKLVPQHVDLAAHLLASLLQVADEVNR